MYYEETFLNSLWHSFKSGSSNTDDKINPDDFMVFGFKALIERRKAIFDRISKNWGITLNFELLRRINDATDLIEAIKLKIESAIENP